MFSRVVHRLWVLKQTCGPGDFTLLSCTMNHLHLESVPSPPKEKFGASLVAQLVTNPPQCGRPWFDSRVRKIPWRRDRLPTPVFLGFLAGSAGKESTCNAGDPSSIPGLGRSPGEGKGYPLQYSGLENSMDCIVHGVTKSWTWLSDFHLTFRHLIEMESHNICLFVSGLFHLI